jgi:F0F1-type ATP synthase epsilon subunit
MLFNFFKRTENKIPDTIEVVVYVYKQKQFSSSADSIETNNDDGLLSLLPGHTNFISIIKDNLKINIKGSDTKSFTFEKGILRCFASKVEVYLGIELE